MTLNSGVSFGVTKSHKVATEISARRWCWLSPIALLMTQQLLFVPMLSRRGGAWAGSTATAPDHRSPPPGKLKDKKEKSKQKVNESPRWHPRRSLVEIDELARHLLPPPLRATWCGLIRAICHDPPLRLLSKVLWHFVGWFGTLKINWLTIFCVSIWG